MNNESAKSLSYAHDLVPNDHNLTLTHSEDALDAQAMRIVEQIRRVGKLFFSQLHDIKSSKSGITDVCNSFQAFITDCLVKLFIRL